MRSLFTVLQNKYILLSGFAFGWFEVSFLPKPMLIFYLAGTLVVDLITGLIKSWGKKEATSSEGFRKTVKKLTSYTGAIAGVWFTANILSLLYPLKAFDYTHFVNGSIAFITFIELYSIFENIYEINPTSPLSKYFAAPILKFLKGKLLNDHPVKKIDNNEQSN